jgi:hypothetical protein
MKAAFFTLARILLFIAGFVLIDATHTYSLMFHGTASLLGAMLIIFGAKVPLTWRGRTL